MKFTLGFSPCPNDTFIFDALVNRKIDTGDYEFDVILEDVQTLNHYALNGKLDFSKISYGVLPLICDDYKVLRSGGALGKGVGPLLITAAQGEKIKDMLDDAETPVAIPGEHTTAHFLLMQALPFLQNKTFRRFDGIEDFVLQHENSFGVIIHENRFTYQKKGLQKVADLGTMWEEKTGYPIPLGGIVGRQNIDVSILQEVDTLIRKSVEYAFIQYPQVSSYVCQYAQEMEPDVMRQHINLYVNDFSLDMGDDGEKAIQKLMQTMAPRKKANILRK